MENLRIKKNNIYTIEVNDEGETIEFDLEDISLRAKLFQALDKIKEIENEFYEKSKDLKTEKDIANAELYFFQQLREAMDSFLGEGACRKIFGDRNYYSMFDDLFKELNRKRPELGGKSHFDKMRLSVEETNKKIVSKYKKNKKRVI